jgi:tetratricopeptide (TPR) repeat protein
MKPTAQLKDEPMMAGARNDLASVWMKRGISLLEQNTRSTLGNAVSCFDQAIALRSRLVLESNPWFRYGLAAGWMNRGDALTRLGSLEELTEAVRSYDEALNHLRVMPLDENPLFRKRLAIAFLNRGVTLLGRGDLAAAVGSLDEAIAALKHEGASNIPEQKHLLGCAWMNRGNALLLSAQPDFLAVRDAAREAMILLAGAERNQAAAAEAGLKARHVLCRAAVGLSGGSTGNGSDIGEWIAEATDAVDDGLQLTREWELRGVTSFRTLAGELFRFGARAYQIYQPHFLAEYILENLDPEQSPGASGTVEMRMEAMRSLWCELRRIQTEAFKLNPVQLDQLLRRLSELSAAEKRLNELQQQRRKGAGAAQNNDTHSTDIRSC